MNNEIPIGVAGHPLQLYADVGKWECGHIKDGISFRFAGEGGWVIDIDELSSLLRRARRHRREQEKKA